MARLGKFTAILFFLLALSPLHAAEQTISNSNFTMFAPPDGALVGGATDVNGTFDDTKICNTNSCTDFGMTLKSDQPFFGVPWFAHDIRIFSEGVYTFDSSCTSAEIQAGIVNCAAGPGPTITLDVGPGQLGAHILFDYNPSVDIDVVLLWDMDDAFGAPIYDGCGPVDPPGACDPSQTPTKSWNLVSRDGDNSGIRGFGMVDGPFIAFEANFNLEFEVLAPGTPTAGDFTLFTLPGNVLTNIDMLANANDGGPPGTDLSLVSCDPVAGSTQGTVQTNMDDTCDYTAPAVLGDPDDQFTYTVFDSVLTSPPGTVAVDLVNEAPSCTPVDFTTSTNTDLTIAETDLLVNCTDPDGAEPLSVDLITLQPAHGTLSDPLPPFVYTPDTDYLGPDSFEYTVSDTRGGSFTATADIQVSGNPFGNFTMLDADGVTFGGTNDVASAWDGTLNTAVTDTNFNMTMKAESDFKCLGFGWTAHDIRMFGPGTYIFDTSCSTAQVQQGLADCGGAPDEFLTLTVGAGQIGAHMLFDWNVTENIDVVNLYEANAIFPSADPAGSLYQGPAGPTPDVNCLYEQASIDGDGDGIPGVKFIDGPFIGFRANFNQNFNQNCGAAGEIEVEKSSIRSSHNGGCTLSRATVNPLSRGDYWLMLGLIALLGTFTARRIILNDK